MISPAKILKNKTSHPKRHQFKFPNSNNPPSHTPHHKNQNAHGVSPSAVITPSSPRKPLKKKTKNSNPQSIKASRRLSIFQKRPMKWRLAAQGGSQFTNKIQRIKK
jgi:predicted RNA-binding protein with PUA-like domain